MQREQIREQFSLLEEQLERLLSLSAPSLAKSREHELDVGEEDLLLGRVKKIFDDLHGLVREETLKQKSLSAHDFTQKLIRMLILEANQKKFKIAVAYHCSGRISMEMVEVSMAAILSSFKASLRSYSGHTQEKRTKLNLSETYSFYLELHGHSDEFHFRMTDDGAGFDQNHSHSVEIEANFSKVRASLAKCGGWFNRKSFVGYGGQIEFKVPLPRTRQEVSILKRDGFELLIPCFFVVESTNDLSKIPQDGISHIGILDPDHGILPYQGSLQGLNSMAVRVGVADFEAWIICDYVSERLKSRKYDAREFLESGSWLSYLGLCVRNGMSLSLPLLDGDALMQFYSRREK